MMMARQLTFDDLKTEGEKQLDLDLTPVNFMRLPKDIDREWFNERVRQLMAENAYSEIEARLRLGERARHLLIDGRTLLLEFGVEPEWHSELARHEMRRCFIVDAAGAKYKFDEMLPALDLWTNFERKWAVEIALKALEIEL